MPLISRRDLFSAGMAAGLTAVLPQQLLAFPSRSDDALAHPEVLAASSTVHQAGDSIYSLGQQAAIIALARNTLTQLFAGKTLAEMRPTGDILGIAAAERVNITLRHAGRIRGSDSSSGVNLGGQVIASVYHAAMDRSYGGRLTKGEVPDTILEVWIQTGSSEVSQVDRFMRNVLTLGVEGVEIEHNGQSTYYLPSVPVTSTHRSQTTLLQALCVKAGLAPDVWLQPEIIVRRTRWLCLPSVGNAKFFGQTLDADAQLPIRLRSSIDSSANYLIRNQDASGRTAYLYDPIADQFVGSKTNLIRSAGCLFALSQVLESSHGLARDAAFRACAIKMARGLLDLTVKTDTGMRILHEEDFGSAAEEQGAGEPSGDEEKEGETPEEPRDTEAPLAIGATALLAAALSGNTLRKEFAQEYHQLYRSIVSAQKPDGRFLTHFGVTEEDERAANFYPGEALLVLALEAERQDAEALEMCRRAFHPYVLQFRKAPTSAFIVWHSNVWSRIASLTGEQVYADFVFEQADWLLQMQIESHPDPRWIGGFSQSTAAPQVYSVAFTEAIVRALSLAARAGDSERMRRYADSVRSGLHFCGRLKIEETPATWLGNPMNCKGGIAFGLIDRRIRCDSVQHFITLCLAAEQIANRITSPARVRS